MSKMHEKLMQVGKKKNIKKKRKPRKKFCEILMLGHLSLLTLLFVSKIST